MSVVVDSSVLIAALLDTGLQGVWAEDILAGGALHARELIRVEATNTLRRLERAKHISTAQANAAHDDLTRDDGLAVARARWKYCSCAVRCCRTGDWASPESRRLSRLQGTGNSSRPPAPWHGAQGKAIHGVARSRRKRPPCVLPAARGKLTLEIR